MLLDALRRIGLGKLAHNTVLGTFWQFTRIAAQSLWVVLVARSLGPSGYGTFAGVAGLATTLSGFAGLGTGLLLLQNVSRDHSMFDAHWRRALLTTFWSGLLLGLVFFVIAQAITGSVASAFAVSAIGASELVCFPIVYAAGFAFQAHEHLGWSNALAACMSIARLLAVLVFWCAGTTLDLTTYAGFHLAASIIGALSAIAIVHFVLRPHPARYSLQPGELREGLGYSMVWLTGNALTELDKTLVLRLSGNAVAGMYSAAYRLVSALMLPVAALVLAAQPRLFRQSAVASKENPRLLKHLAGVALAYGLAASVALLFLAPLLPILLGHAFEPAVEAARCLLLLPPVYALRLVGNTALMTNGKQMSRVLIEGSGIVGLVGLALLWMPRHGVAGAALTITTTETLLAIMVWTVFWNGRNRTISRTEAL